MKLEKSHYWKAVVEIEANNIAFATVVNVHRKGMRIDFVEVAKHQSWLNGSDILFDVVDTLPRLKAGDSLLHR